MSRDALPNADATYYGNGDGSNAPPGARGSPMLSRAWRVAAGAAAVLATAWLAHAQEAGDTEIARYREMMSDPMSNPGFLSVDRGEALWSTSRGASKVSLQACDLGEGPGKLEGAFARLPRYFADADAVMDVEQRLLWCMRTQQGLDAKPIVERRFAKAGVQSDMEDLVAFIANKSSGMTIEPQLSHPREQEMAAAGEALFHRRAGAMDFACSTCHGEPGKRIRLQGLPDLFHPSQATRESIAGWPTYRVSQSQTRTMQNRLWDCFRQQRWPEPAYASDAITALELFLNKQAAGGVLAVPSIKR